MKTCFKCKKTLPIDCFYAHPFTADKHLGKCKECTKKDVSTNYSLKVDRYRRYEKERLKRPERRKAKQEYHRKRAISHPEKHRANMMVGNAIRSGKLIKKPCESCGDPKSEAHHDDYSKPLDVRWLCFVCHRIHHGQLKHGRILQRK